MSYIGVLKITNGTKAISILAEISGANLNEWIPAPPTIKGDGVWGNSPYTDGRILLSEARNNVIDSFNVKILGGNQNGSIYNSRQLISALQDMIDYQVDDWQVGGLGLPVWIEAQGRCEEETRYAYLYQWALTIGSDPYIAPFSSAPSVIDECNLVLEHSIWRDHAPGGSDCLRSYSYVPAQEIEFKTFEPIASSDEAFVDEHDSKIILGGAGAVNYYGYGDWEGVGHNTEVNTGIRFRNVAIASTIQIVSACVELEYSSHSGAGDVALITGEKVISPAAFSTYANFMGRTRTTANIPASIFTIGTHKFFDVTSIINEIISLPGWASGNNLVIFFDNSVIFPVKIQGVEQFFNGGVVKLIIQYYGAPTTQGITTPQCTNTFAVGYHVNRQITQMIQYEAATGATSVNLISTQPSDLFPALPLAVGDMVCFGSDAPFTNLVLNLGSAGDGTVTYDFKFSTAAGFNAGSLTGVIEYPYLLFSGLGNTGLYMAEWSRFSTFAPAPLTDLGGLVVGPTLYWVCIRIAGVAVAPGTQPNQVTTLPYSTTWDFWEVDEDEVGGDIEALLKFLVVQFDTYQGAVRTGYYNHLLVATRHYRRGAEYTPFLNYRYNQTGVVCTAGATPGVTTPATPYAPCGQAVRYTVAGATAEASLEVWGIYGTSLTRQYSGTFRIYARIRITAGAANVIGLRCRIMDGSSNTIYQSEVFYNTVAATGEDLIDLGIVSLQADGGLDYTSLSVQLRGLTLAAATFDILDIAVFPADETIVELMASTAGGTFNYVAGALYPGNQPLHDSTMPKEGPYSGIVDQSNGLVYPMATKSLGPFTIRNNTQMRVFFLPWNDRAGLKGAEGIFDGQFKKVQQYWLLRGET